MSLACCLSKHFSTPWYTHKHTPQFKVTSTPRQTSQETTLEHIVSQCACTILCIIRFYVVLRAQQNHNVHLVFDLLAVLCARWTKNMYIVVPNLWQHGIPLKVHNDTSDAHRKEKLPHLSATSCWSLDSKVLGPTATKRTVQVLLFAFMNEWYRCAYDCIHWELNKNYCV